jgi:hypothetical protein
MVLLCIKKGAVNDVAIMGIPQFLCQLGEKMVNFIQGELANLNTLLW